MRCNKCGGEISTIHLNVFDKEGSDYEESIPFTEGEEDAVVMDVDSSWVGYCLSEEEQIEDIRCPICGEFPFSQNEVQVYDIVRIVCFHEEPSIARSDEDIVQGLELCNSNSPNKCKDCPYKRVARCTETMLSDTLDLINRKQAEIERLQTSNEHYKGVNQFLNNRLKTIKSEAIKEFVERVDEILKRYAHLHKYAEKARHSTEEYADGTPMEMVSVWEVLSLKKWEMCDYETMSTLQDNIETIEKARLLSELEKDFMSLKKEIVGDTDVLD